MGVHVCTLELIEIIHSKHDKRAEMGYAKTDTELAKWFHLKPYW
jgi:hypothetical protein